MSKNEIDSKNKIDQFGNTELMIKIDHERKNTITQKDLENTDININHQNKYGISPLMIAIARKKTT